MTRFVLLGGGWRAEFFARVARALPEEFELAGIWSRTPEKALDFARRFRCPVAATPEDVLKLDFDYVINTCPWEPLFEYNMLLIREGVPVLSETPPAPDIRRLELLWEACHTYNAKFQVAEQYFAQPYFQSILSLMEDGVIGVPQHLVLSMIHGYHGVNIIRRLLGVGMETCTVSGRRFREKVVKTGGRDGLIHNGELAEVDRDYITLEFDSGKVAHYDFSGEQYHSHIRSRSLRLCGDRGEVSGTTVRYITAGGDYAKSEFQRVDLGQYSNLEGASLRGIMMDGRYLYRNPYGEKNICDNIRLNDDELAIATVMGKMKTYLETGEPFYPLADACQDTYLSFLMTKAAEGSQTGLSKDMPWSGKYPDTGENKSEEILHE